MAEGLTPALAALALAAIGGALALFFDGLRARRAAHRYKRAAKHRAKAIA